MKWRRLKFTGMEPEGLKERERGRERGRERKWKGEIGMVSDGRRRVGEMKRRRGAKRREGRCTRKSLARVLFVRRKTSHASLLILFFEIKKKRGRERSSEMRDRREGSKRLTEHTRRLPKSSELVTFSKMISGKFLSDGASRADIKFLGFIYF